MPRPRITLLNLPVEIHCEILKYARYSAQKADYGKPNHWLSFLHKLDDSDDDNDIVRWEWIEEDKRKLSQFPYNVAAVCKLWRAVLIKIPECWTRVIIDVANDPSRFLDIFSWSRNLSKLEVTIFNSHTPDSQDMDYSSLERERVSAIVDALRPHASRCKSITFDVVFLTSLPSPVIFLLEDAPYLKDLILECKIDNAGSPEEYSRTCDIGVRGPVHWQTTLYLDNLSLTGFWFMFLAGHPYTSERFRRSIEKTLISCLRVSLFQFQEEGQYTLHNFVSYCSVWIPMSITLSDLSLKHLGPILTDNEYDEEVFSRRSTVEFKNVSTDVIESIFFLADVSPEFLIFDNCAFPDKILSSEAVELYLRNIPHSIQADSDSREKPTNLASILQDYTGTALNFSSCPTFDDTMLSILPGYEDSRLVGLALEDCDNITVRGIQQYLERRNTSSTESQASDEHLKFLNVDGTTCPFPTEEEKEWFRSSDCTKQTSIQWNLRNPENLAMNIQEFSKDEDDDLFLHGFGRARTQSPDSD